MASLSLKGSQSLTKTQTAQKLTKTQTAQKLTKTQTAQKLTKTQTAQKLKTPVVFEAAESANMNDITNGLTAALEKAEQGNTKFELLS